MLLSTNLSINLYVILSTVYVCICVSVGDSAKRAAILRVIRYCLHDASGVQTLIDEHIHWTIVISFEKDGKLLASSLPSFLPSYHLVLMFQTQMNVFTVLKQC